MGVFTGGEGGHFLPHCQKWRSKVCHLPSRILESGHFCLHAGKFNKATAEAKCYFSIQWPRKYNTFLYNVCPAWAARIVFRASPWGAVADDARDAPYTLALRRRLALAVPAIANFTFNFLHCAPFFWDCLIISENNRFAMFNLRVRVGVQIKY